MNWKFSTSLVVLITLSAFLIPEHVKANEQDVEVVGGTFFDGESANESSEIDFTVYVRMDVLFKNQLFIDPGQEELIDYLDVSLGLDFYYGRFFIEANNQASRSNRNSSIGYRLVDDIDYQLDFLFGQTYLDGLSEKEGNLIREEPSRELQGIRDRDDEINQGLRFTKFNDNQAWWVDIAGDPFNISHGGWILDGYFAHVFQVYNWEFHVGTGATFFSKEVVNHHAGISVEEVRFDRPLYEAGFGSRYTIDLTAQYPLGQDWLFMSGFTYNHFSNSFGDSPLYKSNQQKLFSLGIMYVW